MQATKNKNQPSQSPFRDLGQRNWWKILCVLVLVYAIIAGFLMDVPRVSLLQETIRNLYFHVCMWFAMMILFTVSLIFSVRHLSSGKNEHDLIASEASNIGILFGILGIITGSIWAKFTWSQTPFFSTEGWWINDVKLNGAVITILTYLAYIILRNAIMDEQKRGKVSAVYNIFAYVMMFVFIQIYPRMTSASLHPGNGGNPAFNIYDLDNTMRMVFYPAVIGWTLLGIWIMTLRIRIQKIKLQTEL